MSYLEHEGKLWEFTTTSPSGSNDWHVECVEVRTLDGFFGVAVVSPSGTSLELQSGGTLPVPVLQHWLSLLPRPLEDESDG